MSVRDTITITSWEIRTRIHNWTKNLPSGTAISGSPTVNAFDLRDDSDVTGTVVQSESTVSPRTTFAVQAPASSNGRNYRVQLRMTRDDGERFQDDYLLKVRDH